MSDPGNQPRVCQTCGTALPPAARYCPNCGTPAPLPSDAPSFEDAIADVLDDVDAQAGAAPPPVEPWPVDSLPEDTPTGTATPPCQPTDSDWTATPESWSATPGDWAAPTVQPAQLVEAPGNRVLWIALGVLGFVVFCCCGFSFVVFALDAA